MKYFIIIFIFILCVFIGYIFSIKYKKRKNFFSSIITLANKLSLEINFSRERLKILIENSDFSSKKYLYEIDKKFVDFLDKKSELTEEYLFEKIDFLTKEEKEIVYMFFKTLGRSDVENQTKEIQNFLKRFSQSYEQCESQQKKYGPLSVKLGIVAGLFFAVLIF